MKTYLYSIFVRSFLAFSGFLVFILTAALFGAEGRGVIGYGTSLFAITGLFFSGNLGRSYLGKTKQNESIKRKWLGGFLVLNIALSAIAASVGLIFWTFSASASEMLTGKQAILFSFTSLFYVWSANGNSFFASFIATKKQENIILLTRLALILFLIGLYFWKVSTIDQFITGYVLILFMGTLTEILYLYQAEVTQLTFNIKSSLEILKNTIIYHIDYLSFNLFPLVLTVVSASFIEKAEVGRFNFALQIINLIFLLSTTANIRVTTYVSDVGFRERLTQIKKLFWATLALSALAALVISAFLSIATEKVSFGQFKGVHVLFLMCALSIPGYTLYQFFSPIWIEIQIQKRAAIFHFVNFLFFLALAPVMISSWGLMGATAAFSVFHMGLLAVQILLYFKYFKKLQLKNISNIRSI